MRKTVFSSKSRPGAVDLFFDDREIARIRRFGAPIGALVEHRQQLPRCMGGLRQRIITAASSSHINSGIILRSDLLSEPRGRFQRNWYAPPGGLYLALAWADTFLPEFSRLLPFAVGIGCCETMREIGVPSRLKWVNDIHVNGRKIGGILCETVTAPDGGRFHLVGIGLNINIRQFSEELQGTATSLYLEQGREVELDTAFNRLVQRLRWNFGLLCLAEEQALAEVSRLDHAGRNIILQRWLQLSDTVGNRVYYGYDVQEKPLYEARVLDVDRNGGLVMELDDATRVTEYSGEIIYLHESSGTNR